jgi:hypothetical protein
MAVKFLNYNGSGWTSDAIDSVEYCVLMGADIMSNSWGGGSYSQALEDAIESANNAGMLFVASAGNGYGDDNDRYPRYPSSYTNENVIAVLSTNYYDYMSNHSNYGLTSVDIGAPGGDSDCRIYSCYRNGGYYYAYGTSMAGPHISGACALIWSICPSMSHLEVKDLILQTVDQLPTLIGRCVSGGRLNLYNAVLEAQTACSAQWIQFIPDTGVVGPGEVNDVNVVFNADREPGTYRGHIAISSDDPYVQEMLIPVTMTVEPVDYFTELFGPNEPVDPNDPNCNDMANRTLTFKPNSSSSYYSLCVDDAAGYPVDPNGGTIVSFKDDDYIAVDLNGASINFYGTDYNTFYIGSNGYITFISGDIHHFETLADHFDLPRISALFDDLDPSAGGMISWKQLDDQVVVTFENVPEHGLFNSNSFQIEMRFDGKIKITLLDIVAYDGLIGLSDGYGLPSFFNQSNLSEYNVCDFLGDLNGDLDIDLADFAIFTLDWQSVYDSGTTRTVRDEFNTVSYSGNEGTVNWSNDWQERGESDGPSRGILQVVNRRKNGLLHIGNKSKGIHPVVSLTREADLSSATTAALTYEYYIENSGDAGAVNIKISGNGGSSWDTLANYNAGSGYESFDISPYISSNTQIRFETGSEIRMHLFVDNIQIEYDQEPSYHKCDFNQDFSIDFDDLFIYCERWLK